MEVERDADVDADDGPHNGGSACSSGECPMLSACERRKTDDLSVGILTEESTAISSKQGVTDLIEKGTVDLVEEGTACLTGEGIAVPIEEETTDPTEEETVCSMEEGTAGPTEEGTVDSMGERKAGTKEEMKAGTKEERRAGTEEERTAKEVEKEALGITMERLGASDEEKLEILDFEGNDDGNDDSQVSEIEAARSDDDCDDDIFNVDLLSRDEGSSTEVPPEKVRDIVASGSNTAPATAAMTPSTSATVKTADRSVATSSTGPCDNLEVVDLLDSDEEDEEASIGGSQKIQATQKQEDGGAETIGWSEAEKFASNKNTPKLNSWSATPTMYPGSHYYGQPPSINGNNPPIEMPSPYNGGYHSHPAPPHNNVHFHHYGNHQYQRTQLGAPSNSNGHRQHHQHSESNRFSNSKPPTVEFIPLPSKFLPTWSVPIPPEGVRIPEQHVSSSTGCLSYSPLASRRFRLSLLSMTEFTISAVSLLDGDFPFHLHYNGTTAQSGRRGTSTPYLPHNLGIKVRKMARAKSVKAVYETYDDEDANCTEERWRLPLAIYHDLYVFLISPEALSGPIRNVQIDPISSELLKMASLGSEWSGRDFPDPEDLHQRRKIKIELAMRLAPFQRGGVDFIAEKNGNALLADEMGLGKTVQAIASMSLFHEEWPLLVLTPSSTRFHWKHEFQFWLGKHSSLYTEKKKRMIDGSDFSQPAKKRLKKMTDVLDKDDTLSKNTCAKDDKKDDGTIPLLKEKQIHVISSGKDLWSRNSRVVICSYGLIPSLAKRGFLKPGTFRCCIVDESHMLKNMSSKRTATLLPILKETTRCLMLSGTPAFAKPIELFPQLNILGRGKWWNNEAEYRRKYCLGNRGSAMGGNNLGELHALLSSTVMLRRLKG
uniref:Helicase ATP-binding domain-containing protein n=1 Tax=Corethron hystrix TaxID=216773 RepID=A0A7S1FTN0_9STRA|mmetsp:Transcript_26672/g.61360  ORF Transcript_26672/g.61360 Transcript_26672/m.61360 type:complete len:885 (+) Transcript_26672:188-2842(+)